MQDLQVSAILLFNNQYTNTHRIRRIKCDEAKPSCYKCKSTRRKCDGYWYPNAPPPLPLQPPSHSSLASPYSTNSSTSRIKSPISFLPSLNPLETDNERRSFAFFH